MIRDWRVVAFLSFIFSVTVALTFLVIVMPARGPARSQSYWHAYKTLVDANPHPSAEVKTYDAGRFCREWADIEAVGNHLDYRDFMSGCMDAVHVIQRKAAR
jgi:hypothetical protein